MTIAYLVDSDWVIHHLNSHNAITERLKAFISTACEDNRCSDHCTRARIDGSGRVMYQHKFIFYQVCRKHQRMMSTLL